MDGILRDVKNMRISCHLILAGWHHYERDVILALVVLAMTLC